MPQHLPRCPSADASGSSHKKQGTGISGMPAHGWQLSALSPATAVEEVAGTGQVHGHASSLSHLDSYSSQVITSCTTARTPASNSTTGPVRRGRTRRIDHRTAGTLVAFTAEGVRTLHQARESHGSPGPCRYPQRHRYRQAGKRWTWANAAHASRRTRGRAGLRLVSSHNNQGPVLRVVALSLQAVSLLEERHRKWGGTR